jgi:hypothetical protein
MLIICEYDEQIVVPKLTAAIRFGEWGNKKMIPVYGPLKKSLPKLKPICDMVATRLYHSILARRPLSNLPRKSEGVSIEELLHDFDAAEIKQEMVDEDINMLTPQTHRRW